MTDTELPFFLRECNHFPFPVAEENDDSDDDDEEQEDEEERGGGGRRRRRAFQLVGNRNALLETNGDAAELLLRFLKGDSGEGNVIWLHNDIYITEATHPVHFIYAFSINRHCHHHHHHHHRSDNKKKACSPCSTGTSSPRGSTSSSSYVSVCHIPSGAPDAEPPLVAVGPVSNFLLQLLATHKTINYINICRVRSWMTPIGPFPASLDALKTFVREAQCPRKLCFDDAGLAAVQWRVVAFHCNRNVTLSCIKTFSDNDVHLDALMDAMNHNQCPTNLQIYLPEHLHMLTDANQDFGAALQSTTLLKSLEIRSNGNGENFISLCEAISRNHGLQDLKINSFGGVDLSDAQWDRVLSALASHPTMQTLALDNCFMKSTRSPARDQIIIQQISRNTVLCQLDIDFHSLHSPELVCRTIRRILQLNRFRPVLHAIKYERNAAHRQSLLTTTILHSSRSQQAGVWSNPAIRYLLLKENADLLVGSSGGDGGDDGGRGGDGTAAPAARPLVEKNEQTTEMETSSSLLYAVFECVSRHCWTY